MLEMKFKLITQAFNIPNFDNQASELADMLNEQGYETIMNHNKQGKFTEPFNIQPLYEGFQNALDLIEMHPELIRPTLYKTMIAVKEKYRYYHKFNNDYSEISAVSLVVNYLYKIELSKKLTEDFIAYEKWYNEQKAFAENDEKGAISQ